MNTLRLILLCSGSLLVASSAVLVACSSEDTVVNPADSGTDVSTVDVVTPPSPDAGDAGDAGTDSAPPFEGGTQSFADQLAIAMCKSLARCCFGDATLTDDAGVDGGHYDYQKCFDLYHANGFETSLWGIEEEVDAGVAFTLDAQQAGNCLAHAAAIACNVDGADLAQYRDECFNAFYTTTTAGAPCLTAAGCGKGLFCNYSVDGGIPGGGTCQALRGDGGACGDFVDPSHKEKIDEACSWRGKGGDQFCQYYSDFDASVELDAGQYYCAPANGTGGDCISDKWCKAGQCNTDTVWKCESPAILFPPAGLCPLFVKP
jgi:hypothetical protein